MGTIFNIQKFCIHDGDGIRTCVFLKGCPLRCIWCHNPESLDKRPTLSFDKAKCSSCGKCLNECPARSLEGGIVSVNREACTECGKCVDSCLNDANEIIGKEMTAREVLREVIKDKMFYDTSGGGITVTGGEPSYQPDFSLELLRLSKNEGISTAIETCGIGSREFYKEVADLGTTILFDIKCIDPQLHKMLTGADNSHIMANLQYLMDRGSDIIIRLPLIPDCNDSNDSIKALCDFLNKTKGKYRYAEIMPYHSLGVGKSEKLGVATPFNHTSATDDDITRWRSLFNLYETEIKISK